jgi:predicted component of type VI protein secretion system
MKVQLVVVQGKPEGKTIPLAVPQFKIGRGEGCQLRPSNDQVSREHAMLEMTSDAVFIQDLGSRNGTEVNGTKLAPHEPLRLKNGDLVKIGPLTFAMSIEGAPVSATSAAPAPVKKAVGSIDDLSHDDIGSWLVSDASKEPPDRPSGVYGGDTMTFDALKLKDRPDSKAIPAAKAPTPAPAVAPVPQPEPVVEDEPEPFHEEEEVDDGIEDLSKTLAAEAEDEMPEDMIDESNPFFVKKKAVATPGAAASKAAPQRDSSDAANDILRKMMDRRKASKS